MVTVTGRREIKLPVKIAGMRKRATLPKASDDLVPSSASRLQPIACQQLEPPSQVLAELTLLLHLQTWPPVWLGEVPTPHLERHLDSLREAATFCALR